MFLKRLLGWDARSESPVDPDHEFLDKKLNHRKRIMRPVHVLVAEQRAPAVMVDISLGGARLAVNLPRSPGDLIGVEMVAHGEKSVLTMRVAWSRDVDGASHYGGRFEGLSARDEQLLEAFIRAHPESDRSLAGLSAELAAGSAESRPPGREARLLVGLDIGHHAVKAAFVTGDRTRVVHLATEVVERAGLEDRGTDEHVLAAVRRVLASGRAFSSRRPAIWAAVDCDDVVARYVEVVVPEGGTLQQAAEAALTRSLPVAPGGVRTYPTEVPPLGAAAAGVGAFVVSVRQGLYDAARKSLDRCGITVEQTQVSALPLLRTFCLNADFAPGRFQALVHCGSRTTVIAVARDGFPYSMRSLAMGGADFTRALLRPGDESWGDAEWRKFGYELDAEEDAVEAALTKWTGQVKKSLLAFTTQHGVHLDRVTLSGGVAAWAGLTSRLARELALPVEIDRWHRISVEGPLAELPAGPFSVALGLVL